jgi:AraC-binding-like domain
MAVWDVATRPDREQFGYWHEVICQAFVPLTPRRAEPGRGFAARVETRTLHDMVRARIRSQPQETAHGPRDVARTDGAFFFVNLQVAGRCRARQGRADSVVGPGRFTVVDTTEPYWFDFDAPWQMVSFRLPRDLLTARLGGARPPLGEPFDAAGRIGGLGRAGARLRLGRGGGDGGTTGPRRPAARGPAGGGPPPRPRPPRRSLVVGVERVPPVRYLAADAARRVRRRRPHLRGNRPAAATGTVRCAAGGPLDPLDDHRHRGVDELRRPGLVQPGVPPRVRLHPQRRARRTNGTAGEHKLP